MFDFRFEFHQAVSLDPQATGGRALVDGVMHLWQRRRFEVAAAAANPAAGR